MAGVSFFWIAAGSEKPATAGANVETRQFFSMPSARPSAAAGPAAGHSRRPLEHFRSHQNFRSEAVQFSFSEISQFPSKSAVFGVATLLITANIHNIHGVILIFMEFFWSAPLPTPEK